jgi:hypothetical protein
MTRTYTKFTPTRFSELLTALREGPVRLEDSEQHGTKEVLSVTIHRLREAGYGIRTTSLYELIYEPETHNEVSIKTD